METEKLTLEIAMKYPKAKLILTYPVTTTDYLRSINIDIDGLQEKGVAVYD